MNKTQRLDRIIARGEFSDHAHVITGNVTIDRVGDKVFINCEDGAAVMRHLLESSWIAGIEQWTGEHADITIGGQDWIRHGDVMLKKIEAGRYQYIHQSEYDPFDQIIRNVRD
jgi:hypothetical protein